MNEPVLAHPLIVASLQEAPVIERGDYDYLVHPLTDGVPRVDPALLEEAARGLARLLNDRLQTARGGVDLFVTAEAMGLPLVTLLSARTALPYVIARKRSYGLSGEIPLDQITGYSRTRLHLNGVEKGDRVVVIDDLISTGGTLRALAAGIQEAGAHLVAVVTCVTKQADLEPLARELGCAVGALATVAIETGTNGKRVRVTATDTVADA